jgi:hypothetical protein
MQMDDFHLAEFLVSLHEGVHQRRRDSTPSLEVDATARLNGRDSISGTHCTASGREL